MTTSDEAGGNTSHYGTFDPVRLARLEERMAANGDDVRELKEARKEDRESHDDIKRQLAAVEKAWVAGIGELKVYFAEKFGELKGAQGAIDAREKESKEGKGDRKWLAAVVISSFFSLAALVVSLLNMLRH